MIRPFTFDEEKILRDGLYNNIEDNNAIKQKNKI